MEPTLTNIIPALVWLLFLGTFAWRKSIFSTHKTTNNAFLGLWIVKLCTGILVWGIYTFYYTNQSTSDIYRFFADSKVIYGTLFEQPGYFFRILFGTGLQDETLMPYLDSMNNWYKSFDDGFVNENRTLIRLNAVLMIFTGGSYFGNLVILCFLGVWAQSFLYKVIRSNFQTGAIGLFIMLNMWPSQLFWTSALMKEPLVMIGLALSIASAIQVKNKQSNWAYALLPLGIWLTLFSKFYVGIALIFPLSAYLITPPEAKFYSILPRYAAALILLALFVTGLGYLFPGYDIPTIIAAKQRAFANVARMTEAGSAFYIPELEPTFWSIIKLAPLGIFNSLLRPLPSDSNGFMELAAVTENVLFVGICAYLLFKINLKSNALSLSISLCILALIILVLGGITVNISGALVRYKMPAVTYLSLGLWLLLKNQSTASKN